MKKRPSLEHLIEGEALNLEILHPGGLEITKELAELCYINNSTTVLDVASGTGETACYLVQNFGCQVTGVDASDYMLERARRKSKEKGLTIEFKKGNAHNLPSEDNTFDVVISECTTCLLEKEHAIREMMRVIKPGGYVGIHDICWKENTPDHLKHKLAEMEGGSPETLEGWKNLFEMAGVVDVITVDKSYLIANWEKDLKKTIGIKGLLRIFLKIIKNWGISGIKSSIESRRIFQSGFIGYGIIVGRKP